MSHEKLHLEGMKSIHPEVVERATNQQAMEGWNAMIPIFARKGRSQCGLPLVVLVHIPYHLEWGGCGKSM